MQSDSQRIPRCGSLELSADQEKRARVPVPSQKPILYVLNVGEKDAPRLHERRGVPALLGPRATRRRRVGGRSAELASSARKRRGTWSAMAWKESG